MRTLEEIKRKYDMFSFDAEPTEEERKYYSINENTLRKWRTDKAVDYKKKLFDEIDNFNYKYVDISEAIDGIQVIDLYFAMSTTDIDFEDNYYHEMLSIFKKMYENDMFDYLSYDEFAYGNSYRSSIRFANQEISELYETSLKYDNQKYAGIIPLLYYSNHLDVFEEVLKYFANTIYQKYGLYLQYSMNILIKFCKEYNLPYVEMLEDAKKRAKELDYPSNHEFKYQFIDRREVIWDYKGKPIRTIKQIKSFYFETGFKNGPIDEEKEFHSITEETLMRWRTENCLEIKNELYEVIHDFDNIIAKNQNEKMTFLLVVHNLFKKCCIDNKTENSYYYEIPSIIKKLYDNNMFDILSHKNCKFDNEYKSKVIFANEEKKELEDLYYKYDNQKYAGIIPLLYYSNHLDVFEEVLKYFANTIYQKYGLYLQYSMNILIKFCKEYNLPYVEMLEDAKKRAKELDYPSNHEFKYQFLPRLDVKWE